MVFAVEVKIENESVYLVYLASPTYPPEDTLQKLKENMTMGLEENYGIIYNKNVYPFVSQANENLINAIVNKVKPSLTPLLLETKHQ